MMIMLLGFILVVGGLLWLSQRQARQKKMLVKLNADLDTMQKDASILRKADINIHHAIKAISQEIAVFEKKLTKLNQSQQLNNAYQQALKLFEMGASIEDVLSSCRLSNAEAELLQNLHLYKNTLQPEV